MSGGLWAPFTNKIFACITCGRTCCLVGFKKVSWGAWINQFFFERSILQLVWLCFNSPGKILSSLNCAWPHLSSFCHSDLWFRFFSSSTSQTLVCIMQEAIPSVEMGVWQLPPELSNVPWQSSLLLLLASVTPQCRLCSVWLLWGWLLGLLLLRETFSSSWDLCDVSIGLLVKWWLLCIYWRQLCLEKLDEAARPSAASSSRRWCCLNCSSEAFSQPFFQIVWN